MHEGDFRSGSEDARLAALADLAILDTESEREFDALTSLAANIFGTESAAVSLIDKDRQWFKSRHKIDFRETPRDVAFCDHVVADRSAMVVLDTLDDARFASNPLVIDKPNLRFYAGAPIYARNGQCLGSLCILDGKPRSRFGNDQVRLLEELAGLVNDTINARAARLRGDIGAKVLHSTPDAVLATNRSAEIVYWNEAAEKLFGWSAQEALGTNVKLIIPESFHGGHQEKFEAAAAGGPTRLVGKFIELSGKSKDGAVFPVELSLAPWGEAANGGFAAIVRDISDRKKLQRDRDNSRKFLDAIVANLPSMLFVKDTETLRYLLVNKKGAQMMGRRTREILGKDDLELFPAGANYRRNDLSVIEGGAPATKESVFVRDDETEISIRTTRVLLDGPDRPNQYLLGLSEDMSEVRRAEAERWHLARYDTLTGLFNRTSFLDHMAELIASDTRFSMLSVDLDRFKSVNDQFGHVIGDDVLKEVGARLNAIADKDTCVARIGGDEFAFVLVGSKLKERAKRISKKIVAAISKPINVGRVTAYLGASVGVVIYPDDGTSLETLRQNGDLAMYRAKAQGDGIPCFFDAEMDALERDRRRLETALRRAVDGNEVSVAYQPIVEVSTGEVSSFEALARWTHPRRGPISPDLFISLAEDCGLIDELGAQILETACSDALNWPERVRVAVNLSPRQFYSGNLVQTVFDTLDRTGLPPGRLQLEVTENLVIKNPDEAFSQLSQLKEHGVQICVDDFGVGYSSLGYFKTFQFDKVKIDKSFIGEIDSSKAAKAIVSAVVGLATELSISVVAEGVETSHQRSLLTELGCSHLQGYLFSAAVPSHGIQDLLKSQAQQNEPSN